MWILVDDVRNFDVDHTFRTGEAAIEFFKNQPADQVYDCIMLDHDLGDENAMNGYTVACWIIENNLKVKEIQIVSANPVGVRNIAAAFEKEGFMKKFSYSNAIWVA